MPTQSCSTPGPYYDQEIVGFVGTRVGLLYEGEAEAGLLERGARVLVVTSGNHRTDAHLFYESQGYTFTGRRYKKALPSST
jgi:hypothetical protein